MKRGFLILCFLLILLIPFVSGACVDVDVDGYGTYEDVGCSQEGVDCDDTDSNIYPGSSEVCDDFLDNNCDGLIDGDDPEAGCSQQSGGDVCGDGVCEATEDEISCLEDCSLGDDFGSCLIVSAEWYNAAGDTLIETAQDGDSVTLVGTVENTLGDVLDCDGKSFTFEIFEVDGLAEGEELGSDLVLKEDVLISSGQVFLSWPVVYAEEALDALGTTYPEYVLYGGFYGNQDQLISTSEPTSFLPVYPQNVIPPEDVETDLGDDDSLPVDYTGCMLTSVAWYGEDGIPLPPIVDEETGEEVSFTQALNGDSLLLVADVSDCEGKPVTFKILEFGYLEDGSDFAANPTEIVTLFSEVVNGQAMVSWTATYLEDEDDVVTSIIPDFGLSAALISGEELFDSKFSSLILLVLTPELLGEGGAQVHSEIGEVPETFDDTLYQDEIDSGVGYDAGSGAQTTGVQAPSGFNGPSSFGDRQLLETCGNQVCEEGEAEVCPDDCLVFEGGAGAFLFFIVIILFALGAGGFFFFRKWRNKKKFMKEAQNQESLQPQMGQQGQVVQPQQSIQSQQQSQPVQVQQPQVELLNPYTSPEQLQQVINFIISARKQGLSDDKVKEMLKKNKYTGQHINYAFSQIN